MDLTIDPSRGKAGTMTEVLCQGSVLYLLFIYFYHFYSFIVTGRPMT